MARVVVIAPDSFKGSIRAADAAAALAAGWADERPRDDLRLIPMADGGEGTLDAFEAARAGARRMPVTVHGPDGRAAAASWLLLPPTSGAPHGTGVVELASTSGIELLAGHLLPRDADTTGFGEAIAAALDHGVSRLVLGIGSSASTDGGAGLLRALGARFADAAGAPIARGSRGLDDLATADLRDLRPLPPGGALVLSDVTNPLLGVRGAAAVFGPQKGLDADGVARADAGLAVLAGLLGVDPSSPGTGAAGGTGLALRAWGARLAPGSVEVAGLLGLEAALASASVVLTGEGSFDGQSAAGKAPAHVGALAAAAGVPAALVAGRIEQDANTTGFAASVSLTDLAGSTGAALADPAHWLRLAGRHLALALG